MKATRTLRLILTFVLTLALCACSAGAGPSAAATAAPTSAAPASAAPSGTAGENEPAIADANRYEKPLTISVYTVLHPSANLEDYPAGEVSIGDQAYMDRFNITLDYRRVPNANSDENYNIMLASGDITDVVKMENLGKMAKYRDAWLVLDGYAKDNPDYPNLNEKIYQNEFVRAMIGNDDGEFYLLPKLTEQFMGDTFLVRADLVAQWGLNMDDYVTKEDFYELFKLVEEKSGGKITPYMTRMYRAGLTQRLCEGWSGMREDWYVDPETMQVKFGCLEPAFRDVIDYCRMLYAQGLVDPEYPTTNTSVWQEAVLAEDGGVFMVHDNASSRINWANEQFALLGITDRWYEAVRPVQPGEGDPGSGKTTIHYPTCREYYAIFTGVDEEKVTRILDMFEFSFTDEGAQIAWGIEGYNYYYDEEGIRRTLPEWTERSNRKEIPYSEQVSGFFCNAIRLEENNLRISIVKCPTDETRFLVREAAALYEDQGYIQRNWLEVARKTDEETDRYNKLYPDIETFVNENLDQFIMGVKSMDQWDGFVQQLKSLKIDECLQIQNDALARSLAAIGQ
jgi:putative aldouronate transport system substrate-binding protein